MVSTIAVRPAAMPHHVARWSGYNQVSCIRVCLYSQEIDDLFPGGVLKCARVGSARAKAMSRGTNVFTDSMYNFDQRMASVVDHPGPKGWFVSVLELGAWFGVLCTGYLADRLSRKYTIVLGALPKRVIMWNSADYKNQPSAFSALE